MMPRRKPTATACARERAWSFASKCRTCDLTVSSDRNNFLSDFPVHEAFGDELQHLDLPRRRLLLELAQRVLQRDHVSASGTATPRCNFVEAARVRQITGQDLLALCSVHAPCIGASTKPL